MAYEIMWGDLTKETQAEIIELAKKNGCEDMYPGNYDIFPLTTIPIGDGDDDPDHYVGLDDEIHPYKEKNTLLTRPIEESEVNK